jgi:hypothetical protein
MHYYRPIEHKTKKQRIMCGVFITNEKNINTLNKKRPNELSRSLQSLKITGLTR